MSDIFPPVVSQFILIMCIIMAFSLVVSLSVAAWRNHFYRHTTRPVVIASAVLFAALTLEFTRRLILSHVAVSEGIYSVFQRNSPITDLLNVFMLVGMGAWFYTVVIAYPDVHKGKDK
jgi:hypothetical protein